MYRILFSAILSCFVPVGLTWGETYELAPLPSPADNPLKGLVPYARPFPDRFPHSMEFNYIALSQLMVGENKFEWQPLEDLLNDIASRGNQSVIRIFVEYPGKKEGIPQFLIDGGLKVHRYLNTNTAPFPPTEVATPDYEDKNLRAALQKFISAFGEKYDGDARFGYITAGLLGTWGEWHTYPRNDLWASKEVQTEILESYAKHFKKTPVLLRYPAGKDHYAHAPNVGYPFGYHDDSFAWATLDTGKESDNWYFMPSMKAAGALDKWKEQPIGGEIRPEAWGKIFDDKSQWPEQAQSFRECVDKTHVTWLMDTGLFREKASSSRYETAIKEVQRMGYDFFIDQATIEFESSSKLSIEISVRNQGVAPFYAEWPTWVRIQDESGKVILEQEVEDFRLRGLLPSDTPEKRRAQLDLREASLASLDSDSEGWLVLIGIKNPLSNGKPLRFANEAQDQHLPNWLTLGKAKRK